MHQVTIVTIDEVDSLGVLKLVAIVEQGIEAESRQGVTEACLDLKIKTNKPFHFCECVAYATLKSDSLFSMASDWEISDPGY